MVVKVYYVIHLKTFYGQIYSFIFFWGGGGYLPHPLSLYLSNTIYLLNCKWKDKLPGYFLCHFQHLNTKSEKKISYSCVKKSILNKFSMFVLDFYYIHEYAYMQIINIRCWRCYKHFEKMLALLRLIFKHYKRGSLQNNGINTKKNQILVVAMETCRQIAYPAPDFCPTTRIC